MPYRFRLQQRLFYRPHLLWVFALLCAGCTGGVMRSPTPALPTAEEAQVRKNPEDPRAYRLLTLDNGLRIILISAPNSDRAAASLSVAVGSRDDPPDRPGLAHFLEHMLFLGTDLYPQPGEYQRFIIAHGGRYNAYTAFDHSNYFFSIQPAAFVGALQRFSRFFIAPQMDAGLVEREREAVDAEYHAGLEDAFRREQDVLRTRLNPEHPYSRFAVGNLETLGEEGLREALLDFYQRSYSAERMTLALLSGDSLETLETLAHRYFAAVPNRKVGAAAVIETPLFAPGSLPQQLRIEPLRDRRELTLLFPLPDPQPHYRSKPLYYIANLVGHEGKGSLLSLLKSRGWAESLVAGGGLRYRRGATFNIRIGLTERGFAQSSKVVAAVFAALRRFRDEGVIERIFTEEQRLAELRFRFQEPAPPLSAVRTLSRALMLYPGEEVLSGPMLLEDFNPGLIHEYLDFLQPQNCLTLLTAKDGEFSSRSPRYSVRYSAEAFSAEALSSEMRALYPEIAVPVPNPFIPGDVAMLPLPDPAPPALLVDEPGLRLWHRRPVRFRQPRADVFFILELPEIDIRRKALAELLAEIVSDELNEYSYPALLADLHFSIHAQRRGIEISLSGYHDRQEELLTRAAKTLARPALSADRFADVHRRITRTWRNKSQDSPYTRLLEELQALMETGYWPAQDYAEVLETIDLKELRGFARQFARRAQIQGLVHGNLSAAQARSMGRMLRKTFAGVPSSALAPLHVVRLAAGESWQRGVQLSHNDRALLMYLQAPSRSDLDRAAHAMSTQIFRAGFFHELRTVRQLGYVVFHANSPLLDVPGSVFVVQAPDLEVTDLDREVRWFVQNSIDNLATLTVGNFARHRRALLNRILEEPKTLNALSHRYWEDIELGDDRFDRRQRLAAALQRLSQAEWSEFYRRNFSAATRRELRLFAPGAGKPDSLSGAHPVENIEAFRRANAAYSVEQRR